MSRPTIRRNDAGVCDVDERFARRRFDGRAAARPPRRPFTRVRQRRAGVRHRARAVRADVAPARRRDRRSHTQQRRLARRVAVPQRAAGRPATACAETRTARSRRALTVHSDSGGALGSGRSTTSRSPTTATRTSPPATARSSPSTCTRRRARPASPACRAGTPLPNGPDLPAAVPDADRVLGLRVRRPGRTGQRHRRAREPDGLRGRRREHARHRLLGRRVRLLRAAAEPRRLRRDRDDRPPTVGAGSQGRDDGHLVRRDQPAVHGAARPARPRGHLAAVGPRRHRDDALSGRHPQHRLRGRLGAAAPAGGGTRRTRTAGSRGRTSRSRAATRRARPTRCCTARRPT